MVASLWFSLTDWNIGGERKFIGLGNYHEMFTEDKRFYSSLKATAYFSLGGVPLALFVAFIIAILLNQPVRGRSAFRTIFYLPTLMPAVANAVLWLWMFNPDFGLFNEILRIAHLPTSQWIYSSNTAVPSLLLMSAWGFGNAAVIFLAGLQGIPTHLYEAVAVDGGGPWNKFLTITVPMMTPTIFFNLVMGVIGSLQVFETAYIMTSGGPGDSTLFYVFYLFRTAFEESRMGYASALAWVLFIIVVLVTGLIFRTARSWIYYEGGTR